MRQKTLAIPITQSKPTDDELDEALANTFPASDPVSMEEPAPANDGSAPGAESKSLTGQCNPILIGRDSAGFGNSLITEGPSA